MVIIIVNYTNILSRLLMALYNVYALCTANAVGANSLHFHVFVKFSVLDQDYRRFLSINSMHVCCFLSDL